MNDGLQMAWRQYHDLRAVCRYLLRNTCVRIVSDQGTCTLDCLKAVALKMVPIRADVPYTLLYQYKPSRVSRTRVVYNAWRVRRPPHRQCGRRHLGSFTTVRPTPTTCFIIWSSTIRAQQDRTVRETVPWSAPLILDRTWILPGGCTEL